MQAEPRLRLRRAHAAECATLSAIAHAAKAHWGYSDADLARWREDLTLTEDSVRTRPTQAAEIDGRVVGFYQLAHDGRACRLEHFWVHPAFMHRGIGRRLLIDALERAAREGATCLAIDADPHAEPFYLACGAVRTDVVAAPIAAQPDRVRPQLRIELAAARRA